MGTKEIAPTRKHDGDDGNKLSNFMSMVKELLQLLGKRRYYCTVQVWMSKNCLRL